MKCKDCNWWKSVGPVPGNGVEQGKCHGGRPVVTVIVVPQVGRIAGTVTPKFIEVTARPTLPVDCDACGDFKVLQEVKAN